MAALFGINENRARVALSRMAARGEVVADGQGRYRLGGRLLERSGRLTVSRSAATGPFSGEWHVVVVTAAGDTPATRRARRHELRRARLGELRDGTWVRPANLELALDGPTAAATTTFLARPQAEPARLAAIAFDLEGWARRATHLCRVLENMTLDGPRALAEGFECDAEVLRHLQRDPLLPAEILPGDWPGPLLRARFDEFDVAYRRRLRAAHRASGDASAPSSTARRATSAR